MKKITLSFLTWYLLADFVPCAISATLPVKSDRETKLKKREPCVIEWSLQDSLELLAQQENKNMGMLFSQSSDHLSRRGRRGCNLLTCSIHDLAYHINRLSNKMKAPHARSVPVATAGDEDVTSINIPRSDPWRKPSKIYVTPQKLI